MISIADAIQLVHEHVNITEDTVDMPLPKARGYVLNEAVRSPIDMPPFRQSAMDGYALNLHNQSNYKVIGEIKAGDGSNPQLAKGEAVRIFTGAPVPESANAVIMQERTDLSNGQLKLTGPVNPNDNIRPLGEQIFKDAVALESGTRLTPGAIAFLTSLGITSARVYKRPSIAVLVTGNELAEAGTALKHGQIYESNALMLQAAMQSVGYTQVSLHKVADNYEDTVKTINAICSEHDVLIISGGISVGDYDFVGKALNELGVSQLFYKVRQKPGKPLYFGMIDNRVVFALPGNPAAALSCFYLYVLPALEQLSGNPDYALPHTKAAAANSFKRKPGRPQFLKAIYRDGMATILDGQNSSMLHTFALANALVFVSEEVENINSNDEVEVILLPEF